MKRLILLIIFAALSAHAQGLGGKVGIGGKAGIGGGPASGGAITIVQQTGTSAAQISGCTTCQVELPSAAGGGHLIVASIASAGDTQVSSVCDSSGSGTCSTSESTYSILNPVKITAGGNIIQSVYTCSSASGVQYINITMNAAVSEVGIMAVEVSNVPSCGLDATACPSSTCPSFTGTASSSPVTTGTFSTATSSEIAIGFANDEANCQTFSASGGNTLLTTPTCTQTGMGGIYEIYSSTQSSVTQAIGISVTGDPVVFSVAVFQ